MKHSPHAEKCINHKSTLQWIFSSYSCKHHPDQECQQHPEVSFLPCPIHYLHTKTSIVVWSLNCVRLFSNPMNCSLPGFSVHGISQAGILEWVAISSSRGSFWRGDRTCVFCIVRWILYHLSHLGSPLSLSAKTKGFPSSFLKGPCLMCDYIYRSIFGAHLMKDSEIKGAFLLSLTLAVLCGMRHLNSSSRDQVCALYGRNMES